MISSYFNFSISKYRCNELQTHTLHDISSEVYYMSRVACRGTFPGDTCGYVDVIDRV